MASYIERLKYIISNYTPRTIENQISTPTSRRRKFNFYIDAAEIKDIYSVSVCTKISQMCNHGTILTVTSSKSSEFPKISLRGQKNRLSESQEIFAIQLFKNKKYENGFMDHINKKLRVRRADIYQNHYVQMKINAFF